MKINMALKSQKIKRDKLDIVSNIVVLFFALINIFPLYWMFSNSLKSSNSITRMPPEWIPQHPSFDNYVQLLSSQNVISWAFNSVFISVLTTVLVVFISSLAAYAFAKLDFYGNKVIFVIFISTLMIPKDVYIIPLFKIMQNFNLINTRLGVIIPNVALPFGVFILKQFFDSLPNALRESAKIDGASEWTVYLRIIIPMAKAGIGALFILVFVRMWNDYLWQLIMLSKDSLKTLQLGIASLQTENVPNLAFKITGASLAAIPMIIVFLCFQSYFTRGITLGAVKE
ncbi:MAG TPA: carbohydrate ABC transporter permease [Ruminiclostridium sp.]